MRAPLALLAALLVAGCGGSDPSPESVVRAWSSAVSAGDEGGAARLFAEGAQVIRFGSAFRLRTYEEARAFNARLACLPAVQRLRAEADVVRATFTLARPTGGACGRLRALFRVREGKIVLWHQLDLEPPRPPASNT
jgi:hypothetical protein